MLTTLFLALNEDILFCSLYNKQTFFVSREQGKRKNDEHGIEECYKHGRTC